MNCPACGTALESTATHCPGSGYEVGRLCTAWGRRIDVSDRFCRSCGHEIGSAAAPAGSSVRDSDSGTEAEAVDCGGLFFASLTGSIEEVRQMLEAGCDPDARDDDGMTPLMTASWHGNLDVVRLLLESAVDADRPGIVRLLAEHGADLDRIGDSGMTPADGCRGRR